MQKWLLPAASFLLGVAATIAWTGRLETHPAGERGMMAWVHDRWTGTITLCQPGATSCYPL